MKKLVFLIVLLFGLISVNSQNFIVDNQDILTLDEENKLEQIIDSSNLSIFVVTVDSTMQLNKFKQSDSTQLVVLISTVNWEILGSNIEKTLYNNLKFKLSSENFNIKKFKDIKSLLITIIKETQDYNKEVIEKQIAREKNKEFLKSILNWVILIIGITSSIYLIYLVVLYTVNKIKKRKILDQEIKILHDDIIVRKTDLINILGKVPSDIQKVYKDKIMNNDIKANIDTKNRLQYVLNIIVERQNLIKSTNNVITNILLEKKHIKEYLNKSYDYCEEYLKDYLEEILPDTKTDLFITTEFTKERYFKLKNINNSLSGKFNSFMKKLQIVSSIVNNYKNKDNEIEKLKQSYEKYKTSKIYLHTLPIGERLNNFPKIEVDKYIKNIHNEIIESFNNIKENNYENASYHYGIYMTTKSVLLTNFKKIDSLVKLYKRSEKNILENKKNIKIKLNKINNIIGNKSINEKRINTLANIKSKINKFNNNIAYDVILASNLLDEILKDMDNLQNNIDLDIKSKKEENSKKSY